MIWPFVSRDRYQEMISVKDRRIAELEDERRMLWDKICLLGIGAPAFAPIIGDGPKQQNEVQNKTVASATPPSIMRPSAIMRRMDRLAEAKWLRKNYPSKVKEHAASSNQQSAKINDGS
jgi:hypothetical protein